jgi:hypothetical protein
MATYTEIPYWMSKPWGEVCAWSRTVRRIQDADRTPGGG